MSWEEFNEQESKKEYFKNLMEEVETLYSDRYKIKGISHVYPERKLIFRAFEETPLSDIRVVIIGQDPYHRKGQANGLAFAVNENQEEPPSLKNITKESGCTDKTLMKWANQGVFLLNTYLCVIDSQPMSCSSIGWETYTNNAVEYLVKNTKNELIFCLWGAHAQSKKEIINGHKGSKKVHILESSHPSPLSAYKTTKPFIGCGHFEKINEILDVQIQW